MSRAAECHGTAGSPAPCLLAGLKGEANNGPCQAELPLPPNQVTMGWGDREGSWRKAERQEGMVGTPYPFLGMTTSTETLSGGRDHPHGTALAGAKHCAKFCVCII